MAGSALFASRLVVCAPLPHMEAKTTVRTCFKEAISFLRSLMAFSASAAAC